MKKVKFDYNIFSEAILSHMTYVYTTNVPDNEKKVCLKVEKNKVTVATKSSNILVRQELEAVTEGIVEEWHFVLDYLSLKKIAETYKNMFCTYISQIEFEEFENGIIMRLFERPKEGFGKNYNQTQEYKYQKERFSIEKYFGKLDEIKHEPEPIQGLGKLLDCMIPKMKNDMLLQIEGNYIMLHNVRVIYAYKNPRPDILEEGYAMTYPEGVFLRLMNKYTKSNLKIGYTDNYFVVRWGSCIAYMTKSKVRKPLKTIFKHDKFQWGMQFTGGYFEDILKRYHGTEDTVKMYIPSATEAVLNANNNRQTVVLDQGYNATEKAIYVDIKLIEDMILDKSRTITMDFIDKKSRAKVTYYLCYMAGGQDSNWITIAQIRKG